MNRCSNFDEIFAFGDGGNDLARFDVATTCVAMGDALHPIQQDDNMITEETKQ